MADGCPVRRFNIAGAERRNGILACELGEARQDGSKVITPEYGFLLNSGGLRVICSVLRLIGE